MHVGNALHRAVGGVHPARDRRTSTQVEGIPDGHEGVAGPEGFGVGEGHYRKPACRHLDEGDVLFRVSGNDLPGEGLAILGADLGGGVGGHDMGVGGDEVVTNDIAGAHA